MTLPVTPPQTIGPFFAPILDERLQRLAVPATLGERIRIEGVVRDGDGAPVPDALIELWQANAAGRYRHRLDMSGLPVDPAFAGFGRAGTDDAGRYWFETVMPGRVPARRGGLGAPHVALTVFARGLLHHLQTRMYFEDQDNASDPVLALVPVERRKTLVARRVSRGIRGYEFDIVLQGDASTETVFFAL